jgi:PAS domain S-box-containing protein
MIGAMMDVTYRSSTEEALQLAEEKYRSIFENAVEGIFQSTPDGRFITVNPALVRMLGYDSTQDLMNSCTNIESQLYTDPERRKEFQNQLESQGTVQHFENQVYRKNGSILWISESGRAVRAPNGAVMYYEGTVEDITGLKQAEKERLHLEEQLLQAQRIESIGLLAGGVAHDFNNLLTAIIGYAQIVESRLGPGHPLGPEVKQIVDSGQRAAGLTSQLLAFSRRQTLLRRSVNLNDTLSNLMTMLRRIIGEDVEIRFQQQPGLCSVLADTGQIEQVIMNLAVNARDAMPDGGLLMIATRNVTLDDAYCREHAWAKPGQYALVSVSDNGVGMDAEVQRRIFEPFFTTKQLGKGTGLGLSVVYGIVKQHDALIHVYSSPGHGTTFRIYFKADEPPAEEKSSEEAASVRGGNETVLVAEDEPTLRGLAKTVLEGLGYRVLLAEDGHGAVAECERAMNEIDLLILDLIMPRMGGREAYERIRTLRADECPVIFMTGHAPEILRDELVRSRSAEIVQKPYQLNELGRKVREVLDSRPRAKPQLTLGMRTMEIADLERSSANPLAKDGRQYRR